MENQATNDALAMGMALANQAATMLGRSADEQYWPPPEAPEVPPQPEDNENG